MIGENVDDDAEKGADFPGLSPILWFLDMHQTFLVVSIRTKKTRVCV